MPRRRSRPHTPARFAKSSYARRLRAEQLEDRRLLAVLTVTNLSDSGQGSLRDAIATANATPGVPDEIAFQAGLVGTIELESQLPEITDDLIINGPGQDLLTLHAGNGLDRQFNTGDGFRILEVAANTLLRGLTITGGDLPEGGGAIFNQSRLELIGSTVLGNAATTSGGGISNVGTLVLISSTLSGNTADSGGGLSSTGDLTITSSTIAGNSATSGGGIANFGVATVNNATLSGNSASAVGGGIWNRGRGRLAILNSTLSGNSAANGGGIYTEVEMNLSGSIIANSPLGGDVSDSSTFGIRGSRNLVEDGSDDLADTITGDPLLGPLSHNGGATPTHALLPGSFAINRGDPGFTTEGPDGQPGTDDDTPFDQRGFPRVQNGRIDIGAYESDLSPSVLPVELIVSTAAGDHDGNFAPGFLSLAEAIAIANLRTGADEIGFSSLFETPQTITLGTSLPITDPLSVLGPGPGLLTLEAGNGVDGEFGTGDGFRVFDINDKTNTEVSVEVHGLSLRGADARRDGGAIFNTEHLTLMDVHITGNSTEGRGGGIFNRGTSLASRGSTTLVRSTVSGNSAKILGGGIYNSADSVIADSTITRNSAESGGGVFIRLGSTTLENSTLSHNTASRGGGIFALDGTLAVSNSTVSGNSAEFVGGGVYQHRNLNLLTITSSTIFRNSAERSGGGISIQNSTPSRIAITNSIIAGSLSGGDSNRPVNGSGNLIGDGSGALSDSLAGDPLLGPLADNGGTTQTHALLPGSPALNAGDPNFDPNATNPPALHDQRGEPFNRVADGRIDIGAYEAQGVVTRVPGDYNGDNVVNVADYAVWRNAFGSTAPVTPLTGADGDGDGFVTESDFDVWRSHFGFRFTPPLAPTAAALEQPALVGPESDAAFAVLVTPPPTDVGGSPSRESRSTPIESTADDSLLLLAAVAPPPGDDAPAAEIAALDEAFSEEPENDESSDLAIVFE